MIQENYKIQNYYLFLICLLFKQKKNSSHLDFAKLWTS